MLFEIQTEDDFEDDTSSTEEDQPDDMMLWLERASALQGAAPLKVGLQLCLFAQTIGRTENLLVFKGGKVGQGLSRASVHNALKSLEQAGLVDVRPRRGKGSSVDLLIDRQS